MNEIEAPQYFFCWLEVMGFMSRMPSLITIMIDLNRDLRAL